MVCHAQQYPIEAEGGFVDIECLHGQGAAAWLVSLVAIAVGVVGSYCCVAILIPFLKRKEPSDI